jgi:hypothetical protein
MTSSHSPYKVTRFLPFLQECFDTPPHEGILPDSARSLLIHYTIPETVKRCFPRLPIFSPSSPDLLPYPVQGLSKQRPEHNKECTLEDIVSLGETLVHSQETCLGKPSLERDRTP